MVAPASGRAGKVGRRNELSHCSVLLPMHHAACDCRAPVSPRTLRSTDQSGLQSSSDHSYSYALRCRAGFRGECQRALCHDGLVGKCKGSIAFRSPRSHGSVFPQSLLLAQICRYLQYLVSFHSCNVLSEFSLGPGRHQRCLLRYRESGRRPDVGVAKKVLTSLLDRTRHPALLPVFHQQPLLNFSMDRQNKRCKQVGMFHHREAWMPALQYMLPSRAHAQSVTQTYRRHAYRLRGVLNSAQVVQATRARTAEMPEFGIRGATKTCCTF